MGEAGSEESPVPLELNRGWVLILLTPLTLGMYPLLRCWKAVDAYAALTGTGSQRAVGLAVAAVGLGILASLGSRGGSVLFVWVLAAGQFVLWVLAIRAAVRLRAATCSAFEVHPAVIPEGGLIGLLVAGVVASFAIRLLGALALVCAAGLFLRDHNRVGRAILARSAPAA